MPLYSAVDLLSVLTDYMLDCTEYSARSSMSRPPSTRVRKNYRLDPTSLARAQETLGARTETETIEQALRMVIGEHMASPVATGAAPVEPMGVPTRGSGRSILKLAGTVPATDAEAMINAIDAACEYVDESTW